MRRPDLSANRALRCIKYTALSFFAGEPGSYKRISIRYCVDDRTPSNRNQLGIPHHQPLAAFGEVDLHPCLGTRAFEVEDHAFTEH